MNKEQVEELIFDLKEQINFVKQYRILTNELCNNHISNYDIENFKEKEGIYSTDNKLFDDYEYDLYNFISIKDWEKALQELERYKNIIDELKKEKSKKYDYVREVRTFNNNISKKDLEKFPVLKQYQGKDISYIVYESIDIL